MRVFKCCHPDQREAGLTRSFTSTQSGFRLVHPKRSKLLQAPAHTVTPSPCPANACQNRAFNETEARPSGLQLIHGWFESRRGSQCQTQV